MIYMENKGAIYYFYRSYEMFYEELLFLDPLVHVPVLLSQPVFFRTLFLLVHSFKTILRSTPNKNYYLGLAMWLIKVDS